MPKTLNGQVVDEWVRVGDAESFRTARELARREGLLVGGSAGTAMAAALRYARRLSADDVVVVLCPDTGRNYLSKFHDDDWMAENHLLGADPVTETVGDLLRTRGRASSSPIGPDAPVAEAAERMQAARDLAAPGPPRRPGRSAASRK